MQQPSAAASSGSKEGGREETPVVWHEVITSSQGSYFYNKDTRETTWERPAHYKRATAVTTMWDEPAAPPPRAEVPGLPPPGRVASLVAGLDHPQAWLDRAVSALGSLLTNYQKLNLRAFHAFQKLDREEMRKLVASTLARVNIDEGEILSWIDKVKLEKLTTIPGSAPVPHPPVDDAVFRRHDYFIVGDSSLSLYKKSGAKVTLKSDLEWAWKGGNSCVYKHWRRGNARDQSRDP